MPPAEHDSSHPRRFDFVTEVISVDEKTRLVETRLIPDPRRYETVEIDGKEYLRDRYLAELMPKKEMLEQMVQGMSGLPIYALSPRIESASEYATARRTAVEA
jgi:hypothetical protein